MPQESIRSNAGNALHKIESRGRVVATEDSPSPEILYRHWQKEYQCVLLEFDAKKLPGLIETAEGAIHKRLQQLSHDSDHHTERQVIEDALQSLRSLKKQEPGLPNSEGG